MRDILAFFFYLYLPGFLIMAFWWRGWLLIVAGAIATILSGYVFSRDFDGPGAGLAVAIDAVLYLGAVSGFIASLLVIIGRIGEWTLLRPVIVLPTVLFLIPANPVRRICYQ